MTIYYLIRDNNLVSTIDTGAGDVLALPLLCGGDSMSLMCKSHADNLMANMSLTAAEALDALGLSDLRSGVVQSVFIASQAAVLSIAVTGVAPYHLADIDETYSLWQVDGQEDDLLGLHAALWASAPTETLGLLAAVDEFGVSFYPSAVRAATGMTVADALARRDLIADYLEGLGYEDAAARRASTDEHAQMVGIAEAMGYTAAQLWSAMAG